MYRSKSNKATSRKSFVNRAGKTHRKNYVQPLRGGIRL